MASGEAGEWTSSRGTSTGENADIRESNEAGRRDGDALTVDDAWLVSNEAARRPISSKDGSSSCTAADFFNERFRGREAARAESSGADSLALEGFIDQQPGVR